MPTKYSVSTWADGFGLWHVRVTGPVPVSDGFRRAANRAIRRELSERGAIGEGYRLRVTQTATYRHIDPSLFTVEYREEN